MGEKSPTPRRPPPDPAIIKAKEEIERELQTHYNKIDEGRRIWIESNKVTSEISFGKDFYKLNKKKREHIIMDEIVNEGQTYKTKKGISEITRNYFRAL